VPLQGSPGTCRVRNSYPAFRPITKSTRFNARTLIGIQWRSLVVEEYCGLPGRQNAKRLESGRHIILNFKKKLRVTNFKLLCQMKGNLLNDLIFLKLIFVLSGVHCGPPFRAPASLATPLLLLLFS